MYNLRFSFLYYDITNEYLFIVYISLPCADSFILPLTAIYIPKKTRFSVNCSVFTSIQLYIRCKLCVFLSFYKNPKTSVCFSDFSTNHTNLLNQPTVFWILNILFHKLFQHTYNTVYIFLRNRKYRGKKIICIKKKWTMIQ